MTASTPKKAKKAFSYSVMTRKNFLWINRWLHYLVRSSATLYSQLFFGTKILGREHLQKETGPAIVASNHLSYWDPPLVSAAVGGRPLAYMGKKELFAKPVFGWMIRMLGTFSVNREKTELSTFKTIKVVLTEARWHLGIFPEGTRSKDGSVGEPKKGVAYLAKTYKVPVIPLGLACGGPKNKMFRVVIGPTIPYDESVSLETLTEQIHQEILRLKLEAENALHK